MGIIGKYVAIGIIWNIWKDWDTLGNFRRHLATLGPLAGPTDQKKLT